jgi:polyphosphate:AMP phosphotransferase
MDERGASGAGPSRGDRMRRGALAAYLVVWAALAVSPVDRETWLLENGLVFALAALLLAIRRRFRFSNLSMVLILAFLSLHAVGSHYTYSAAPPGVWARDAFGLARNHYDRFVHLAFGVLWAYPFRELALRRVHAHRIWSYVVPCLAVLSCSSGYEILESWAAQVVNPAIGVAFVGAQGDVWDGQKDMTLAAGRRRARDARHGPGAARDGARALGPLARRRAGPRHGLGVGASGALALGASSRIESRHEEASLFESAELGHKIDKETWKREEPLVREALLGAQFELYEKKAFPIVILIAGVDGAGKGTTVNLLNAWMDPRTIETHALELPTAEERRFPTMWRFWRVLPRAGKIGILFGSWYTEPILSRVEGHADDAYLENAIAYINRFERMLTDEGTLLLKFWFHLSKKGQKKRLKKLEKNPRTRWRVTEQDWKRFEKYDDFRSISEHVLQSTSQGYAPWIVVEGADERYRHLTVGRTLLDAMRRRLDDGESNHTASVLPPQPLGSINVVESLDLSKKLDEDEYDKRLEKLQGRLNLLSRDPKFHRTGIIAVFEGNDAAGKGGAIRRVTAALDARYYRVHRISAPTDEEKAHSYLWRFWRRIPPLGRVGIFDRSWYGRVLVERVEGFADADDWNRGYSEIRDFETDLHDHGFVVSKFWLAISKEEQYRRFKAREETGYKRFKLTEEDWRNRDKWDDYVRAVSDMVDRTSTDVAPWTLVEAEDKLWARIKVLDTLCDQLEKRIESL